MLPFTLSCLDLNVILMIALRLCLERNSKRKVVGFCYRMTIIRKLPTSLCMGTRIVAIIIRLTFTMNAAGTLAATFITVTWLTERDLPKEGCSSGLLHVLIKDLCVGGAQDLQHNAVGYLTFYGKDKFLATQTTAEQRNFIFYHRDVLIPFIDLVIHKLYVHVEARYIPDSLTAVSWTNGAVV